jgi:hypothetical protein
MDSDEYDEEDEDDDGSDDDVAEANQGRRAGRR